MIAKGTFEVKLTPESDGEHSAGRMLLDKSYDGDLVGEAVGQMLSYRAETPGSAGYVAIEHVTATLDGKSGSFVLQHNATMIGGEGEANVIVLPDSGTGELTGLSGKLKIIIEGGEHLYEFDWALPD